MELGGGQARHDEDTEASFLRPSSVIPVKEASFLPHHPSFRRKPESSIKNLPLSGTL
jgi:hypothetical protein